MQSIISLISEGQAGSLLVSVFILLLSACLCGWLVTLVKIPKVAGEILGGIIVGPTVLGALFPTAYEGVFMAFDGQGEALSVFYWLGLAFLMFSSGYESNMEDFKTDTKIIGWLVAGSTVLPFLIGYFVSDRYFVRYYLGSAGNVPVFNVIFSIATAVTSLPVISKIFMDLGLIKHRYARIILATATIQDLLLWVVLSVCSSIITSGGLDPANMALHILVTLGMFAAALLLAPRLSRLKLSRKKPIFSYETICVLICLGCICIGSFFGVNIMYSAFVAGLIFKNLRRDEAKQAHTKLKDLCLGFFTPVYFAIVGLRIHITSEFNLGRFLLFLVIASAIELGGCVIAMRLIKLDWLTSFNLGVAMNARGGPGIVLATVTYDLGIINYEFFCVLIFTVLITSAAAGYWIDFVNKKGKLLTIPDKEACDGTVAFGDVRRG